jgi:hypothetical protein
MDTATKDAPKLEHADTIAEELPGGMLAMWKRGAACVDNFDGDDKTKFARRMVCMNDAEKGGDHLNETIAIRYWMVHEIDLVNDDDELITCYRVVLITPENKAYAFVSEVLARGIREVSREYGSVPLDPPLLVQVKQKATAKGRRCYTLVPVLAKESK